MKNNKLLFLSALAVFSLTSCGGEVTPSVNVSSSNLESISETVSSKEENSSEEISFEVSSEENSSLDNVVSSDDIISSENVVSSEEMFSSEESIFSEESSGEIIENEYSPVLSSSGKIVEYGLYPQTYVSDSTLVSTLNSLSFASINGWYLYEGNYYTKVTSNVFAGESYVFNNGTNIQNGNEYWFKCETIKWNVLSSNNGTYTLVSTMLLDTHNYYENYDARISNGVTIYANNYANSSIRSWLNEEFYNTAFALNDSHIKVTSIDNSASTTSSKENKYVCENVQDKVYLLSYQDYLNANYGFDITNSISDTRKCNTTDYVRANGAWCSSMDSTYTSTYWTRSPSSDYTYCAMNVNSGGYISSYAVNGQDHCVRPSITITIK